MKKITALLFGLWCVAATAQDNYPNKHPEILLGKTVTVVPLSEYYKQSGYSRFYSNEEMYKVYSPNNNHGTTSSALQDKSFTVEEVVLKSPTGSGNARIKLKDASGTIVYYNYSASPSDYYFVVDGGLDFPKGFFCDYLQEKLSGSNENITGTGQDIYGIMINRVTDKASGKSRFEMELRAPTQETKDKGFGVTITFENGKTLTWATQGVVLTNQHQYFSFKELTPSELKTFAESKVVTYTLLNHTEKMNPAHAVRLEGAAQCLFEMK